MKIFTKFLLITACVTVLPLVIFGGFADKGFTKLGTIATSDAGTSITNFVADSFASIGSYIVEAVTTFLEGREEETLDVASLIELEHGDKDQLAKDLAKFQKTHDETWWYNDGSDVHPHENTIELPLYSEIAYVGADGKEIVKITDGDATLRDVSNPANTEFKNEDYFEKTKHLQPGEIYVSRLENWYLYQHEITDQNPVQWKTIEGRDIMWQRVGRPWGVIRFATPIYENGKFIGEAVLALDYRHLQSLIKHIEPVEQKKVVSVLYESDYLFLFDDEGDIIVHPKPVNVKGFNPDGTLAPRLSGNNKEGIFNLALYSDEYKQIYDTTVRNKRVSIATAMDTSGRRSMKISIPIPYAKGEYKDKGVFGGIVISVNLSKYYAGAGQLKEQIDNVILDSRQKLFVTGAVILLFAAFLIYYFSRYITNPIIKLTQVAKDLSNGELEHKIDITTSDEIGQLATSFNQMSTKLSALYRSLEEKVKLRTKELADKTEELEKKNDELQRFKEIAVNRELKMIELKKELGDFNHTEEKHKGK